VNPLFGITLLLLVGWFAGSTSRAAVVLERGADYRILEWPVPSLDQAGHPLILTNRYTELATGLHYRNESGEWQETVAELVPIAGGFMATRGPHQVALTSELTTPGALTVVTSDGLTLRSSPTLLAYWDRAAQSGVRLAQLQPSTGLLLAANTVQYPNAFDRVSADVRAVYTAAGFECDVILRAQLPDPALFGLNPDTTDLEIYTEHFATQPTETQTHPVPVGENELATNEHLHFGRMVLGRGRAFRLAPVEASEPGEIPLRQVWEQRAGRSFLIQRADYRELQPLLSALPEAATPNLPERAGRTATIELPPHPVEGRDWPRTATGRLLPPPADSLNVKAEIHPAPSSPGVVLDSTVLNSTPHQTFNGLTTYYVSGRVNLSGTATFRPGTVLKYARGASLWVVAGTTVDWRGAPYRPVILTAVDDPSFGESIEGANDAPLGTYASRALDLDGSGSRTPLTLTNLVIRQADLGLAGTYFAPKYPLTVRHAQFIHCAGALQFQKALTGKESYFVQNALLYSSYSGNSAFKNILATEVSGEFLTVHQANTLFEKNPAAGADTTLSLTHSIVFRVGDHRGVNLVNSVLPPASPFASAWTGLHYLRLDDPVVAAWFDRPIATQIPPRVALAAELAQTTVTAPATLPQTINSEVTLSGAPDPHATPPEQQLGYHYWPIHFLTFGPTHVNQATLTLTQGVVIAAPLNHGFSLGSSAKLISRGRPDALNRFCSAAAVQELPRSNGASGAFLTVTSSGVTRAPSVDLRFLQMEVAADLPQRRQLFEEIRAHPVADFLLRDCQFSGVSLSFAALNPSTTLTWFNTLFLDSRVVLGSAAPNSRVLSLRHNLFKGGTLEVESGSQGSRVTVQDNLFDGVTFRGSPPTATAIGYNAYSSSAAWFKGPHNQVSVEVAYQTGPLGSYYYPSTLAALRHTGSQTAAAAQLFHHTTQIDQTKQDGFDDPTQVDLGFHYAAARDGVAWDEDQDGLPDIEEDLNGDGRAQATETHWRKADSDGDGALDGEELTHHTDPLDAQSWFPKRLAAWWWEGPSTTWKQGDRGQNTLPPPGTETSAPGVVGQGVAIDGSPATSSSPPRPLRYPAIDSTGRPNLRLDQGSLRLWFKPDWILPNPLKSSGTLIGVGETIPPAPSIPLLGWWAWYFESDANGDTWLKLGQEYHYLYRTKLDPTQWNSGPNWHELVMCYSPDFTRLFHNSSLHQWKNPASPKVLESSGPGIILQKLPTPDGYAEGFRVGSNRSGNQQIAGTIDSLESFNYPLGVTETFRHQQLTIQIKTNAAGLGLQFTRNYQGALIPSGIVYPTFPDPRPLTLWRRPLGDSDWGSPILSNATNETWMDPAVRPGRSYEYQALLSSAWFGKQYRQFVAGIEMPPQHQRGTVLLVVERTIASKLTDEVAQLRSDLVSEGWTVKSWLRAPKHEDHDWSKNRAKVAAVDQWIAANYSPNTTNVIFLLGHVAIPYSGHSAADGHSSTIPSHAGAWTCDAYYGYLQKAAWTDTVNGPANQAGDGKFDQDFLPGIPDFAVGRVDFAALPILTGLNEITLLRRYLAKDSRYRANLIPTFGRVSCHAGNPMADKAVAAGQSFAGAAFDVTPGTLFDGANLRQKVPADLAIHFNYGDPPDSGVFNDLWVAHSARTFADPAKELPITFRQVWFSFACDWARLNPKNEVTENNWLRSSLAWPNYGLAIVGGVQWDFSPLGSGAPLAELMRRGWSSFTEIHRFQSILGDPTLRLFRVTPVANLTATRRAETVTLSWSPSPDVGCRYYVYRSTRGLGGFSDPLNLGAPTGDLRYIDTSAPPGSTYQVRAVRLQVTGSGSFWNLSPGRVAQVPP